MTLFKIDESLHPTRFCGAFARTHLGQAHVAGSGPERKTCRECVYWGNKTSRGFQPPAYSSSTGVLNQGGCEYGIPGKSKRKFPHHASACKFFEQRESPPPISDPERL